MPRSLQGIYDEVLRLRERVHKLEGAAAMMAMQYEAITATLKRVEASVNEMSTADEIAAAVAQHDREQGTLHLTKGQKTAVLGAVGIIIANFVLRLAGIEGV